MTQQPMRRITAIAVAVSLAASASMLTAINTTAQPEIHKLGLGLESTGSACCLSVRLWNSPTSASELVLTASRNLFVTVRGIGKITSTDVVDGYMGAGLAMIFGSTRPIPPSPVRAVQLFMGVEFAVPLVPPQFTINLEGAIEMDIFENFSSYLGGGVHFNF